MATLWTESAVAAFVVLMRFYARAQIQKVGWDDWLMFITLVLPRVKCRWESDICTGKDRDLSRLYFSHAQL